MPVTPGKSCIIKRFEFLKTLYKFPIITIIIILKSLISDIDGAGKQCLKCACYARCCSVRNTTYQRLQLLAKGVLSRVMKAVLSADPLSPVLTDRHLIALDRRLEHVLYEIYKCVRIHGASVALSDWRD